MNELSAPSALYYSSLVTGGEYRVSLSQEQACVFLKLAAYGYESLTSDEVDTFHDGIEAFALTV